MTAASRSRSKGTDITGGLTAAADYIGRNGRREARRAIVIVTDDQTELDRDVEGVSRALTGADTAPQQPPHP